ncbi:acyl-CoA dehydrogenase [Pikeienuella piscinae]|uniref:Acyl-CoA dehydrogenase n=1 Tax=Pikeienuella piscinae TaxID=2748098 RepID=A0A7M3T6D4_9RHOB|nr:acyl-CoA dehydrogenase [Pikeienuella piscinae]QIE57565.1 acyl-CoA dehydrogenase [Pikeienuella piscinae]
MSTILRPRDLAFMLHDVIGVERFANHPAHAGQTRADYDQILDLAEGVATREWAPLAARLDVEEPAFENGRVRIIPEAKAALDAYWAAGFQTAGFAEELGGMGLPFTVAQGVSAWFNAANVSLNGYAMLSVGVGAMLAAHGSESQIAEYLPPILEGRWTGTMCLSEPQAGSGLADIRTRAEEQPDGTYRLFGSKMWISGGEHELSENIVHMVLAKIPGGPAGVKGISLFIVPKILADGTRNDIRLIGLNHKMGFRGTTNCALNFGDEGGAVGWLVGEKHNGLACMFHMMNEARIGVGLGAACLGYTGYLHALEYAKERKQGRAPDMKDPTSPPVPIIGHADVKRMLLQMKSYAEGALMLVLYGASLVDEARLGDEGAAALLDLMTPIMKSWPSEYGLRANEIAIQVFGGAGYTRDYPVERLYRDNRLNHIHEGTRGIQGMDLLGRKIPQGGGAGLHRLAAAIEATAGEAAMRPGLSELAESLRYAAARAMKTTETMTGAAHAAGPAAYLANATIYLDMLGHVAVAWLWLKQALVAEAALEGASGEERAFLSGKLTAARYFHRYELPAIGPACDLLEAMDRTCLDAAPESL